ncbi:RagB/SusD family nutrient uptake outer membrane protein [Parabacteroides bouchesdurhonensis]|uniref:RagB/SusD family nutrient uptake outer membrane protein n=1 Tax=Parabacteroides bouchesdurhonensis TaxID=1936995 RepID=UPI000E50D521|nr:RagB/SusD family nutrient uptake outer membrane protein [Parabacteroides bouchesdurhonensis]RHJ88938.1 RagB/SusD family nutrient uptake outer membrane protein [Bacteroides sp. AM07-16]
MKLFKYIIILCTFGPVLISCTNLDEEVFSQITAINYYQNSENIYAALTSNYAQAHRTGWEDARYFLQEVTADQLMIPTRGKHGYNGGEYVRLHEHKWTIQENFVYNAWVAPFKGISLCNNVIADFEKLDFTKFKLTDATKQEYIAEMRALRAWYYMFLIDFFRHVPIVTSTDEVKGQSSPQEVFSFIESELQAVIPLLPKNATSSRLDQAGAASILVRLYLNAEKWIGSSKYEECARVAQEIIDGKYGSYSIDPDYRGPFRAGINGYKSPENIFEFAHKKNYLEASWMYNMWMHYQDRYSLDNDWQGWNGGNLAPSRDLQGNLYTDKLGMPFEKFPNEDIRKKPFRVTSADGDYEGFFLMGQQYMFDYDKGYGYTDEIITGTEEYNGKPLIYVDQVGRFSEGEAGLAKGSHVIYGEENTGYRLIKFPWLPQSKDLFQMNSIPEIRLAEIYYSLAECKYRAGDKSGAARLLDAVRKRYFSAADWPRFSYEQNLSKLTDDEFVDELGREFLGERHRRIDLVRWNRFSEGSWWDKQPDATNQDIFPIPYRALNANPLLEQTTPGF